MFILESVVSAIVARFYIKDRSCIGSLYRYLKYRELSLETIKTYKEIFLKKQENKARAICLLKKLEEAGVKIDIVCCDGWNYVIRNSTIVVAFSEGVCVQLSFFITSKEILIEPRHNHIPKSDLVKQAITKLKGAVDNESNQEIFLDLVDFLTEGIKK